MKPAPDGPRAWNLEAAVAPSDVGPQAGPDTIQAHGAMIAYGPDSNVVAVSANAEAIIGVKPRELLGRRLRTGCLSEGVLRALETLTRDRAHLGSIETPGGPTDLTAHSMGDRTFLEFEPALPPEGESRHGLESLLHLLTGIRTAEALEKLFETCAESVRAVTQFDRTMVCLFDHEGHVEIVAEARRADLVPLVGLHRSSLGVAEHAAGRAGSGTLRAIADVRCRPVGLVKQGNQPHDIDTGQCVLRSASARERLHLESLGVGAFLSIPLGHSDSVQGMIVGHNERPRFAPALVRAACAAIGELASQRMATLHEVSRATHSETLKSSRLQFMETLRTARSVAAGLGAASDHLLRATGSDGVVARLDGVVVSGGVAPTKEEAVSIYVRLREQGNLTAGAGGMTHCIAAAMPTLRVTAEVSGALAVDVGSRGDWIVWFRRGERAPHSWLTRQDLWGASGTPRPARDPPTEVAPAQSRWWQLPDLESAAELARSIPGLLFERSEVERLAMVDNLTGLPNRLLGTRLIGDLLADSRGLCGIAFLDLDRFKYVNDLVGHDGGDEVLAAVAARLRASVRADDIVVRFGGDAFVVAMCGLDGVKSTLARTRRLRRALRPPFVAGSRLLNLTASVGVAVSDRATGPADLMRQADWAMYAAKERGGDQVVAFGPGLGAAAASRARLANELRAALENGDLCLYYQPIVHPDRRTAGVEALLRWEHPDLGLLAPGAFLDLVEEPRLILDLGAWVMNRAISQVAKWAVLGRDWMLCVNVSPRQLDSPSFASSVEGALRHYRFAPSNIVLEITEECVLRDESVALASLKHLRHLGIHVAIDDFGTGFSSLSRVRDLPADMLKIDKAFVAGRGGEFIETALVRAIIEMAGTTNMRTIAEGVETESQYRALVELGCDFMQGHLFGRPAAPDAM